jgi:2-dehydropantoate 2-reductase
MDKRMNFLVFGAGAIGTYIGGSLARMGHRVTFIERPQVAEELRQRGLRLDLGSRQFSVTSDRYSVGFAASLDEAFPHTPFDFAIYALKSFDTAAFLESLANRHSPIVTRHPLLCLSNGVDNEPALAAALGDDKVIAGTVTSSIGRRAAGDIVLERLRGVGIAAGHPLSGALAAALDEAGLNARLYPRAADMKWSKMLTNLLANATSAILDMTPAEVFAEPRLFALEMAMLREALAVMKAQLIRAVDLPGTPVRSLAWATKLPALVSRPLLNKAVGGGRGGKMPSFHIDLHSGRGHSEVDWLNGAVVRYGEKAGVPTPVNRVLNDTLLALTRGEIPLAEFSRKPEKLLAVL